MRMDLRPKKYVLEKLLHETIRDIPEANRINRNYERGLITLSEAVDEIFRIACEKEKIK